MKIPVLVLAFNRPEKTTRLLKCLLSLDSVGAIYVAIDGPRAGRQSEVDAVNQVRSIAENILDGREHHFLIRDENMGCSLAVSSAINWFFTHEESGLILEDDIHLDQRFVDFAVENLARFSGDEGVGAVNGFSCGANASEYEGVYLTTFFHVWGWATWRRAWRLFDYNCLDASALNIWRCTRFMSSKVSIRVCYWFLFMLTAQGKLNSWAFRWMLSMAQARCFSVTPGSSLTANLGIGVESTHTRGIHIPVSEISQTPLGDYRGFSAGYSDRFHSVFQNCGSPLRFFRLFVAFILPSKIYRYVRSL